MIVDDDFEKKLSKGYSLVTVSVLYYIPDYQSLVNDFVWQTLDLRPKYPRVMKFLNFWKNEIDAVVAEIKLCDSMGLEPRRFRKVDDVFDLLH